MHFIHSPILPSTEIQHCTVFDSRLPRELDILLFYNDYIDIATMKFNKKEKEMSLKVAPPMSIETPLLWGTVIGDHLVAVTETNKLIITETGSSTKKISEIDLNVYFESDKQNKPEYFKYFTTSKDKKMLLISSESDHFFCIDISDLSQPQLAAKLVPGLVIKSVSCLAQDNGFLLLAEESQSKEIVDEENEENNEGNEDKVEKKEEEEEEDNEKEINAPDKKFIIYKTKTNDIEIQDADKEILDIIDCSSATTKHQTYYLKEKSIENSNGQAVISLDSNITVHSDIAGENFCFQVESGVVYCVAAQNGQFFTFQNITQTNEDGDSITIPNPTITKMWNLPGDNLLCALENGKNIIISLVKPQQDGKRKKQNVSTQSDQVKYIEFHTLYANHTILNSNDTIYGISEKGLTVISEHCRMENATEPVKTDKTKIFQISEDSVVATGNGETELLAGSADVFEKKEANFFVIFKKTTYLVTDNEIISPKGEVCMKFDQNITHISSSGFRLIVVTGNNNVSLFNDSFNKRDDLTLTGEITSVSITENYFAVYSYDSSPIVKNGSLSFFDFNFERICQDIHLPSIINSLSFGNNHRELFAACSNGTILRIPVSKHGVLPGISLLYSGPPGAYLIPLINNDKIHIVVVGGKAFLLYEDRLLDLGLSDFDSICAAEVDEYFSIYLLKDGEVVEIPYDLTTKKQIVEPLENTENIVDIKSVNDRVFYVRQTEDEGAIVSMYYKDSIISADPLNMRATFLCCQQYLSKFYVVVVFEDPKPCISLYIANDDDISLQWTYNLSSICTAIAMKEDSLIVNTANKRLSYFQVMSEKLRVTRGICLLESQVSQMLFNKEFIWIASEDGSVCVLKYIMRAERFELVAKISNIEAISCIQAIDDITVAMGSSTGFIRILKIPASDALGFGYSQEIEKLSINLNLPIVSLTTINSTLLYLTSSGSIGGLVPFNSANDFYFLQDELNRLRKQHQENYGFSIQSSKSLLSQYMIVDTNLFDLAALERRNLKEDDPSSFQSLFSAYAHILRMRKFFMF